MAAGIQARPVMGDPWPAVLPALGLILLFFAVPILATFGRSLFPEGADGPTLSNYVAFAAEAHLVDALVRSLLLGMAAVAVGTILSWPLAYFLAFVAPRGARFALLLLMIAPFWTSFTIRAFAWQLVLADGGLIAFGLGRITGEPVALGFLYTFAASAFGLGLFAAMLMTLTLHAAMAGIEPRLLEASAALGGRPLATFRNVVLPLALPAWVTGATLSYIVAVGDYAVPTLLGGGFKPVLAQVMISTIKGTYDLSVAATQAVMLMGLVVAGAVPLALVRFRGRRA